MDARIAHFSGVSNVDAVIFDNYEGANGACPCERCKHCDYIYTHRYGAFEAQRLSGDYVYYCPLGFVFISVIINEDKWCVAGPIITDEACEFDSPAGLAAFPDAPNLSFEKVKHCAGLLLSLFPKSSPVPESPPAVPAYQEHPPEKTGKLIHELKLGHSYPIELEKKLRHAILNGDQKKSKEYLNMLLGQIFFSHDADFEIIKHRVIELIVILSRAAIEKGMDITQVLMLNTDYFLKIETIRTLDELNSWLVRIINRFIGYMFEFNDVKYNDVLNKAVKYIKKHYNEKLTLDMLSREVFLSKAYLSKIFNTRMNCSFTQYINKIRVQNSKPLLLDRRMSIVAIANLVGFEDQSYFTKIFKQLEGVSPGEYRRTEGL